MAILGYTINNFNNYVIKRGAFVKCAPRFFLACPLRLRKRLRAAVVSGR